MRVLKTGPESEKIQTKLLNVTGFNNLGNDQRLDLAVLKFKPGPAVLIELGFISNDNDRNFLIQGTNRDAICKGLFDVLTSDG